MPEQTCPKTQAVYATLQPVLDKLPPDISEKLTGAAVKACHMEQGVSAVGAIAQAVSSIARIR